MTSLQVLVDGQCWQAVKTPTTGNKYNCGSGLAAVSIVEDNTMDL